MRANKIQPAKKKNNVPAKIPEAQVNPPKAAETPFAWAETVFSPQKLMSDKMREFYLSTGYLTASASNESIGLFNLQLLQATTLPLDGAVYAAKSLAKIDDNALMGGFRGLFGVLTYALVKYYSTNPLTIAYHEYGHGTRFMAMGFAPQFDFSVAKGNYYDNYFSYLARAVAYQAKGISTGGTTSANYIGQFAVAQPNYTHVAIAGGVNNEMYQTELVANEMFYRKAHFMYFALYASGKMSSEQYMRGIDPATDTAKEGDLTNILDYYARQGMGVTRDDIVAANTRSLYLSSGTYLLLWSGVKYILTGNPYVTSEFFGFRAPELLSYHSRNGLTHKILAGYRWKNWYFPVSYEWVIKGMSQHEAGLDARRYFDNIALFGGLILGRGIGANAGLEYKWHSTGFADGVLKLKLVYHNIQTFEGERNIRNLMDGFANALSTEIAAGVYY